MRSTPRAHTVARPRLRVSNARAPSCSIPIPRCATRKCSAPISDANPLDEVRRPSMKHLMLVCLLAISAAAVAQTPTEAAKRGGKASEVADLEKSDAKREEEEAKTR